MLAPNRFRDEARHAKAFAISRAIWSKLSREQRTDPALPDAVDQQGQNARDQWAREAGQLVPSEATWAVVCSMIADRVADERHWVGLDERAAS